MVGGAQYWRNARNAALRKVTLLALLTLAVPACGGKANSDGVPPAPDPGGTASSPNQQTNAFGCPGIPGERDFSGCRVDVECEQIRDGHYYFLVERSARMQEPWGNTTRWQFLLDGLSQYAPNSSDALQFSGAPLASASAICDPTTYESPFLIFGAAGEGSPTLGEAISLSPPAGGNPMIPALEGLFAFIRQLPDAETAGHTVVVLTATAPDECPSDVTTAELARAVASSSARVVFIALDPDYDVDPPSLAARTLPFRIAEGEPPSRLVDALNLASTVPCSSPALGIPEPPAGLTFALDDIRAGVSTEAGVEFFPQVSGPEACAASVNGGFYLDPSRAELEYCPCSWARLRWGSQFMELPCK